MPEVLAPAIDMTKLEPELASLEVRPPEPGGIGVAIEGLDTLRLTPQQAAAIKALIYEHKFVVLRDVRLTAPEYVEFAAKFGRLEPYHQKNYHHPEHPEIFVSSNVPMDGKKVGVAGTGQFWHTDYSFMPEPLSFTFVYPQTVPQGPRATLFIDMGKILRELPEELATIVPDRRAFHDATHYYKIRPEDIDRPIIDLVKKFRAMSPGAWHPLVLHHPVTGEDSLYMSEGFTMALEGLSMVENKRLLPRFFEFIQREENVMRHRIHLGDLMMWDNRGLIHHASHPVGGGESCNFRISLYDDLPFYTNPIDRKIPDDVYCGDYLASC